MILHKVTLHNFGGYRGRHTIDLTPPSETQPIVLFGGLNGAGKTTLLDAMQLVLYGKRARCSGRGSLGYEEYLRRSIHRAVADREGAAVELTFETVYDGVVSSFCIHRSWERTDSGARERLLVTRDDIDSILLTERWDEIVEELMPLDIASLFFFDGEKIEALADPERAGLVISTAVESLLGLGLLARLQADLSALERKKRAAAADAAIREELDEIDAAIASAEAERSHRVSEKAARRNDLDRAELLITSRRDEFRQQGGELFEQRGQIEQRRAALREQLDHVRGQLHDLASGSLPLALVSELMEQISTQLATERQSAHDRSLLSDLTERDQKMLTELEMVLPNEARAQLERFIESDRRLRAERIDVPIYLHADDAAHQRLAFVWPNEVKRSASQAASLLDRQSALMDDIDELDRMLAAVPAAAAVAALANACDAATKAAAEARARFTIACEQVEAADKTVNDLNGKRERMLRSAADALTDEEDARRIVEHAGKVKHTLTHFRQELLARHLSRIEAAVLDSLKQLLRKQQLVDDLRLDPETFEPRLYDKAGHLVTAERISAGERQLLAVALLWGLARVSGRRLPTIIDTPLGRLDSTHRRQIAERYFPNASDQVLLLSTDEEIDEGLLSIIAPAVGRSYELRYDDETSSTSIVDGYFFTTEEASDVA